MKIVIAPDSFKESLSAAEVAKQIEAGFREIFPSAEYVSLPVADGGEGTVDAMIAATDGEVIWVEVTGPLGERVDAFYGVTGDGNTAVIEMAAASGLDLVPPELRNPLVTTSYGTGELIRHALGRGIRSLIIGIGGSATNDGGAGMLQALGARFLNSKGEEIGFGGRALAELARIDLADFDKRLEPSTIYVACDVDNPLTGPSGASAVFGPQKGATPSMVALLDKNLAHFSATVKRDLLKDIDEVAGAGAAGGMGAGLIGFMDARLQSGVDIIIRANGLEEAIVGADLVITGEGRIDGQTAHGKAPSGVARIATRYGVPVIGIAGSLSEAVSTAPDYGISAVFSIINTPCSLADALKDVKSNLYSVSKNVAATIRLSRSL